jgi:hypothetical protein
MTDAVERTWQEKMELGGRGGSQVEKSNLGECVKIMTKKLWC